MNFIEELQWRGMHFDHTPRIEEALKPGSLGYIGFDPTAPSLTIGNLVQFMILKLFQQHGHRPVVLMGGATGRVGDPSGKDKERQLKSFEELDNNLKHQQDQIRKLLDFDDSASGAIMINNLDFYSEMNVLDFLRDVGKTLTISYMMAKESVKKRVETGLSFTEFSYQLLQAYDFQVLFSQHDCKIQMGGSDQWGNITSGIEFVRRNLGQKAFGITTPLLTKTDGSKFGKSESGNVWLDPNLTSPYQFYQFWINSDDKEMEKLLKFFSLKSREEIEALIDQLEVDPRMVKLALAEEMCARIHGAEALKNVRDVSSLLFAKKIKSEELASISVDSFDMIAREIPHFEMLADKIENEVSLVDLLTAHTSICASNGDVRRAIKGNALAINKSKVTDHEMNIGKNQLIHGQYIMVENGKKNKYLISFK
jgi:tyrosyl-tRNA synthetase